jgi:Ser/Thr protein kinase RdoA (MazF antagonist)
VNADLSDVLSHWDLPVRTVSPVPTGLINTTWQVDGPSGPVAILQRLNSRIFKPSVHEDMHGLGQRLLARGVEVPALIPTRDGALWLTRGDEVWRVMRHVGEHTVESLHDLKHARSAGALVGRFHAALHDVTWTFHHVRPGAHDTDAHLRTLSQAVNDHRSHRLYEEVAPLADALLTSWAALRPEVPTDLPVRIVHGDLKISNLRFVGDEATAVVDLDTLAHGTLDVELGDALRSWCATSGEDAAEVDFDLPLFDAAVQGYASAAGAWGPTEAEWASIVIGIQRICTELSARFAADALRESYFGWDPSRFATRGDHNLLRARGQHALATAVARARPAAERCVEAAVRSLAVT